MSDELKLSPLALSARVRVPIEEAFSARLRALDESIFPAVGTALDHEFTRQMLTVLWPDSDLSESLLGHITTLATEHAAAGMAASRYERAAAALDWAFADVLGHRYHEATDTIPALQQCVRERNAVVTALLRRVHERRCAMNA